MTTDEEEMARQVDAIRRAAAAARGGILAGLSRLDAAANRVFGQRGNPLYHSGAVVVTLLVVLLVTGLYLLLFYRIGEPHGSVARITGQVWGGRWIRALHRYAADAAVLAVALHVLRLFAQGRSWGPRALAWISGGLLVFVLFVCGWTGYVMVWDLQGQVLAVEGARFLDVLPIFSEPIGRAFVGERPLPGAFFFLNLFLHIALPVGMFLGLWIHVSRLARPALWPPRPLLWGSLGVLLALSLAWPVGMEPAADLLRLPTRVTLDLFYSFWVPVTRGLPAGAVWLLGGTFAAVGLLAPWWSRPAVPEGAGAPGGLERSRVDARLCTGCEQCYLDCPYEAISMEERTDGRAGLVAVVRAERCVSCGICAASCAPMGVGPPGRTGRDQLAAARAFVSRVAPGPGVVVVVGCERSAAGPAARFEGAPVLATRCAGNLHTSVIEHVVRSGAGGVLVVACPPRDCWSRDGPKWLAARLYEGREAELQERVDRRRVRLVHASAGEHDAVAAALAGFRAEVARLGAASATAWEPDARCERGGPAAPVAEAAG